MLAALGIWLFVLSPLAALSASVAFRLSLRRTDHRTALSLA